MRTEALAVALGALLAASLPGPVAPSVAHAKPPAMSRLPKTWQPLFEVGRRFTYRVDLKETRWDVNPGLTDEAKLSRPPQQGERRVLERCRVVQVQTIGDAHVSEVLCALGTLPELGGAWVATRKGLWHPVEVPRTVPAVEALVATPPLTPPRPSREPVDDGECTITSRHEEGSLFRGARVDMLCLRRACPVEGADVAREVCLAPGEGPVVTREEIKRPTAHWTHQGLGVDDPPNVFWRDLREVGYGNAEGIRERFIEALRGLAFGQLEALQAWPHATFKAVITPAGEGAEPRTLDRLGWLAELAERAERLVPQVVFRKVRHFVVGEDGDESPAPVHIMTDHYTGEALRLRLVWYERSFEGSSRREAIVDVVNDGGTWSITRLELEAPEPWDGEMATAK